MNEKISLLSLVSTEELVAELKGRFDSMVIAGIQNLDKKNEGFYCNYYGRTTSVGLCERAKVMILAETGCYLPGNEGTDY